MPNIGLVSYFVSVAATFAGAVIVPYVIVFRIRRNVKTGRLQIGIYGILGAVIALLLSTLIHFPLEKALTMPYVQEALDAQCGEGIVADPAYYTNDPNPAWLSDEAGCHLLSYGDGWECYCEP